jgi:hypothetical protein
VISSGTTRRPVDNPFACHRIEDLGYWCERFSVGDLGPRIRELGGRVAIVGPKGSGKTTLLQELENVVFGEPIQVRIRGGCGRPWREARAQLPRPVHPNQVVLVDGAEQLGPFAWRRLLHAVRPARCLVVTLHRPGRLPTLIECRTDHRLLRELVTELAPAHASALEPGLEALFHRHGGNIRLCFRELYDVFSGRLTGSRELEMTPNC